ncbi:hypothetical protein NMG29_32565 [Streptomyces cocklensis]|uniref:Secreted protein n=1 Tax=Actinacidiphila cocklensis TaxID=887465 RepID=A0A9W4DQF5_9ACTN|nr:hypothetical protein [Actinacidiphila cocklensis]MDD1062878.1 hypothetical protein [Actinacidiphila cocklensis]CAG6394139.1 conserved hypothetical protein [Actinacidiphila cocklensis]
MGLGHRAMIAAVLAGTVAVGLAGCGGGGGSEQGDGKPSASAGKSGKPASSAGAPSASNTSAPVLAQIKGAQDIAVTINSAVRDEGGFVTVQGTLTNNGSDTFDADSWRGNETGLVASGASAAGAVLVDEAGKKRYYVLRDTDGKCLCTMGLTGVKPEESRPFFAQFPSPPPTTTQVEFELPTMPPAKITISEG